MYETLLHWHELSYVQFLLTLVLSFLTGLEVREYKRSIPNAYFIGTIRTYTFIGILGYILYLLDTQGRFYLAGIGVLTVLFALFYHQKLQEKQKGIISLLVAVIVYTYGPVVITQPLWFIALVFVSVIFVVNAKTQIHALLESVDNSEMITFAKLVLLSGVIWPLLPTTPISVWIPMSLSKIWLAVIVVSGISYIGYILQRYVYHEKGFILNGIIGGIYSSTATTVVLARQSKEAQSHAYTFASGIILATGVMHLRLMVIIGFLNASLFSQIAMPVGILGAVTLGAGYLLTRLKMPGAPIGTETKGANINPLELGVAFLFALIFVAMSLATHTIITNYGISGLNWLAFIIGVTDIDPFILSLINGDYPISQKEIVSAILIAMASNNLVKGVSAWLLGSRKVGWISLGGLGLLSIVTFSVAFFL